MSMFDNFNNIPSGYKPDNVHFNTWDFTNEIVRGADCNHIFIYEKDEEQFINSIKVIYAQSFFRLEKVVNMETDVDETLCEGYAYVNVHLNKDETKKFDYHYRALAQLQIELTNGETVFSKMCPVRVFNSLEYEGGENE